MDLSRRLFLFSTNLKSSGIKLNGSSQATVRRDAVGYYSGTKVGRLVKTECDGLLQCSQALSSFSYDISSE